MLLRIGCDDVRLTRVADDRRARDPDPALGATIRLHQLPNPSRYADMGTRVGRDVIRNENVDARV
jgi:hypothetical protein